MYYNVRIGDTVKNLPALARHCSYLANSRALVCAHGLRLAGVGGGGVQQVLKHDAHEATNCALKLQKGGRQEGRQGPPQSQPPLWQKERRGGRDILRRCLRHPWFSS